MYGNIPENEAEYTYLLTVLNAEALLVLCNTILIIKR